VAAGITRAGKDTLLVGSLATELQAAAAQVPAALAAHQRANGLEKEIEKRYEQRDAVVAECLPLVQRSAPPKACKATSAKKTCARWATTATPWTTRPARPKASRHCLPQK
jgi:hypothetical protein